MGNGSKLLVKLATGLVKYHAGKALGESAVTVIAQAVTDVAGEDAVEKLNKFLDQGEQANKILEAFQSADTCFQKRIDDNRLKQAIASKPFASLPKLEKIAIEIPDILDDRKLIEVIRQQFLEDWPDKFSDTQLDQAAYIYRGCLDTALATKYDQLLPTIFRKADRIEDVSLRIKTDTTDLLKAIGKISNQLQDLLGTNLMGDSVLQLQGIQHPVPDSLPLISQPFVTQTKLIQELKAPSVTIIVRQLQPII